MIASSENLDTILIMLRISEADEDIRKVVAVYVGSAEEWLAKQGVKVDYDSYLCLDIISQYVGMRFDDPEGSGAMQNAEFTLAGRVEHLRLAQKLEAEEKA